MSNKDNQFVPKPSLLLQRNFSYEPTSGQKRFFEKMDIFFSQKSDNQSAFILRGYAGTGKTSLISALVKTLPRLNLKSLLLAPTGRAAKVMGNYSGRAAFTIHKIIYRPKNSSLEIGSGFELSKNYYKDTLFIVDEASMLADDGAGSLLRDLVHFVYQESSNRLMLVGDTAQLPPVGSQHSPALDKEYLIRNFRIEADHIELTEVMRQQLNSGILYNATLLRQQVILEKPKIGFYTKGFKDFFKMTGERLEDGLRYAYQKFGVENSTIITRSNKLAVQYNQYIRRTIHFFEEEISAGDLLMIVKNNYTYMADSEKVNFLANGDFAEVAKIRSFEEIYGLRFATLELRLIDYPEEPNFEAKVILDTLYSNAPSLDLDTYKELYRQVAEDYADIANKAERMELIKKDPYLSALQIKFAYALTCHKSQGGQWDAVFVDQGFLTEEQVDKEYMRWLYTAVTRAKKELFMVNFHSNFYLNGDNPEVV
ncbi:ATP-dependent RecD-like DNA helicase [Belliella kenyensis]|uniref:ATP-dependent RecD-like DNA helicase n=1 Tax=Belliella kenyensis TaxID=1472724 RepID=A0ABV8EJI9_9BACT|nr:AAA family ATPase [Belliella kenyensis]MCH7400892.1 AAA family ATPase [Belliella kenyensis]MDN3603892.1 AAA family ATPase [Belliella kenyensis]